MSSVDAAVVEGFEGLDAFRDEWERVFRASACEPSTSFEWTRGLAQHHLHAGDRFFVVRLARDGRAIGFVPLVARPYQVLRQRCLRLIPASEIFNTHSDLLCEHSAEGIDALLQALQRLTPRWDCVRMSKLLEENAIGRLLEDRARARGWICRRAYGRASYHLPLPRTFDEYFAARSAKFRSHARRAEKKLRAAGTVRVAEITDAAAFQPAYDSLLRIEESSWKESHGISIHSVSRQAAFYREWGRAAARAGRLHLQLLTLNDEPIAHNLGYLSGGTYYYLKTSYAAARRPLSPATFLRLRLIESLIARGTRALDFPGTPFDWEAQWTDTVRWQNVLSIHPPTLRGRVLASLDRWTHRSSRVRRLESGGTRPSRVP